MGGCMIDNTFMNKIAKAMGLEYGDEFYLYSFSGAMLNDRPYYINEYGVFDADGEPLAMEESEAFFAGKFKKAVPTEAIAEKIRNIEEELELMDMEIVDLMRDLDELKGQLH